MAAFPAPHAHVITVLNLKGGVGKTHTCWVLAAVAQERRQRILLIDLDPQANLSRSFVEQVEPQRSAAALFDPAAEPDVLPIVQRTPFSHIDFLPACARLATFDQSNQHTWEETDGQFALLESIEELRRHYDFIVFDCPPRLSLTSYAALCVSDYVIVPLEAADWGAQGIRQVTEAINYVRQHHNPGLRLLGYLVSRYRRFRSYQRTYFAGLRKHFGSIMFDIVLSDLAEFEKSVTDRIPVTLRAPSSVAAQVARNFFDEVCRRIADQPSGPNRTGQDAQLAERVAAGK